MAPIKRKASGPKIVPVHNWRTSDEDEIERRRLRARSEHFAISNLDAKHPIFSNFRIRSGSGLTYSVELRSVRERQFACSCVDFRINGLGTCKHVEAVLLHLGGRYKKLFKATSENGSYRIDVVPDHAADTLRLARGLTDLTRPLRRLFDERGVLRDGPPEE
ncbi:MAG: SWIM zinc finger domain-containing protein, partial [Phycisphaerales bacterium]|nr:SWIM zinc finger domain-containing protein [Phycisphaerales bacterium]